jgi:hypothetical protein
VRACVRVYLCMYVCVCAYGRLLSNFPSDYPIYIFYYLITKQVKKQRENCKFEIECYHISRYMKKGRTPVGLLCTFSVTGSH